MTVTIRKERSDIGKRHEYPDDRQSRIAGKKHNYPKFRAPRKIDHLIYIPSLGYTAMFSNFYNPENVQQVVARLDLNESVDSVISDTGMDVRTVKRIETRLHEVKAHAIRKLKRIGDG